MAEQSNLLTVGDLAREEDIAIHRHKYAIDAYNIAPVQRAGIVRLFSREQIPEIRAAVRRIERRREVFNA